MKFNDLEINNVFEEAEAASVEDPSSHVIDVLEEQPKGCGWSMGKKVQLWHSGKHRLGVVSKDVMTRAMVIWQNRNKTLIDDSSLTPRVGQAILLIAFNITQGVEE